MSSFFCPLDDRYYDLVKELGPVGESAFMKYRLEIEIKYFLEIVNIKGYALNTQITKQLTDIINKPFHLFESTDFIKIKQIENKTKHDVKAVEYYLRHILTNYEIEPKIIELVHYGLTSQDINTPALSLLFKQFNNILYSYFQNLITILEKKTEDYVDIIFLAKTHGQPAVPTTLGNQFKIVLEGLKHHTNILYHLTKDGIPTKFGGAVGHLNAHFLTDPEINWHEIFDKHMKDEYNLKRIKYVTQNLPYTYWSPFFDTYKNINCIISDFCQDIWLMISNGSFNQLIDKEQVGSSAMPQKINPIDFENSEGNADIATNLFEFFSRRLSRSRLQRDLTDSTILRNLAMPFAYSLLSIKSLIKGLNKISPNLENIKNELDSQPTIIAEGLQTILRNCGVENGYEIMREITQHNHKTNLQTMKGKLFEILNSKHIDLDEISLEKIITLDQFNYIGQM
jgi:adenylosuccinate lyase